MYQWKKRFLLFTEDQSENIYKLPFIGDSLVEFGHPWDSLCQQFPRLNQAEGYNVTLGPGDMLFCRKIVGTTQPILKLLLRPPMFSIRISFINFMDILQDISLWVIKKQVVLKLLIGLFRKFSEHYAMAEGKKYLFKIIAALSYVFLLPTISILTKISLLVKPRRFLLNLGAQIN